MAIPIGRLSLHSRFSFCKHQGALYTTRRRLWLNIIDPTSHTHRYWTALLFVEQSAPFCVKVLS